MSERRVDPGAVEADLQVGERAFSPGVVEADLQVGQRVFRMRCTVCGAEYGAYGCDIDLRRCPSCQDGAPGVPTSRSNEAR